MRNTLLHTNSLLEDTAGFHHHIRLHKLGGNLNLHQNRHPLPGERADRAKRQRRVNQLQLWVPRLYATEEAVEWASEHVDSVVRRVKEQLDVFLESEQQQQR